MRYRIGAGLLSAAIGTSLLSVSPAQAVDTTPPAVGNCHHLTIEEARATSDPDPAVDCSTRHTSVTIRVIHFDEKIWRDTARVQRKTFKKCGRALHAYFEYRGKEVALSSYGIYSFFPSREQRDAGAMWTRCDLALIRPKSVPRLPTNGDPVLGSLPLSDEIAKCRKGRRQDYHPTTCNTRHQFRATHAARYRKTTYHRYSIERFAKWKCRRKLGDDLAFATWPTRLGWQARYRHVVCYKKTRH